MMNANISSVNKKFLSFKDVFNYLFIKELLQQLQLRPLFGLQRRTSQTRQLEPESLLLYC